MRMLGRKGHARMYRVRIVWLQVNQSYRKGRHLMGGQTGDVNNELNWRLMYDLMAVVGNSCDGQGTHALPTGCCRE
jgi:hypothetical protein